MSNLTIQLSGYFDNNFGDDYMMKIIANSLPEINFVVDGNENVNSVLYEEPNVSIQKNIPKLKYPKLVVTGCGFMINSKAALCTELVHLLKGETPGDYCLGCNIEPLDSFIKKWLIIRKLNKFRLIVCRDKKSLSWLCKYVRKPQKEYLADILFEIPNEWLPDKKNDNNLGISLMHREGDTEDCKYYKDMASIADFWIENNDKGVILMAFDSGNENDVYSCECVKKLMKHPERAEIVAHKNGGEIFEAYSKCSKIVGARFHSVVLGMKMCIPVFPLIFREKTRNLIADTNYPQKGSCIDWIYVDKIKKFLQDNTEEIKIDAGDQKTSNVYSKVLREVLDKE